MSRGSPRQPQGRRQPASRCGAASHTRPAHTPSLPGPRADAWVAAAPVKTAHREQVRSPPVATPLPQAEPGGALGEGRGPSGAPEAPPAAAEPPPAPRPARATHQTPARGSVLSLAPLELENANDTLDILPEDYAVPDAPFCGKLMRAEPDVRVPSALEAVRCPCRPVCRSLDMPRVSYLLAGYASREQLRKALAFVEAFHGRKFQDEPRESIVLSAAGLSLQDYEAAIKGVKPSRGSLQPLKANGIFLVRKGQPSREQTSGLVRMADAPQVVLVPPGVAERGSAPAVQDRRDLLTAETSCGRELDMALIVQYFRRPSILPHLLKRLKAVPGKKEILINDDSASDMGLFQARLENSRFTVMVPGNIHEIRGYNRLAKLVHAKLLVLLQDDDLPPVNQLWLQHAYSAFQNNPKLGLLAGFTGTIQGGPQTGKYGVGRSRIPSSAANGRPFMFVTLANMGPFVIRQDLFWQTGMFNMNFSCRGDPGIGFDYEFSLRTWWKGYQVALFNCQFNYHWGNWGSTGTRANRPLYRRRVTIEKRNSQYHKTMYGVESARQFYWRQGLPGRSSALKTPRDAVKGVGARVHDANDALQANPSLGGSVPLRSPAPPS
uniref:Uncharacterized protein n=1 Tax=Tetraselmis sp. GSL018 TaxID=582737 RepID=A0A061R4F3_9CHLO